MCSCFVAARVWCSTTSPCVRRAPPLRSWVSTNDISSYPLHLLCSGLRADETCQLQVSSIISMRDQYASPVRKGYSYKYACICIFITVILSNCPTLSMDSPSMCRLGSFSHMLCSGSDAEFRQCLPVVLRVHILSVYCRDVYQENSREVLPKFCVGSGAEHGKTNPIYTYSGGIRTYLYLLASRLHGRNKTDKLH